MSRELGEEIELELSSLHELVDRYGHLLTGQASSPPGEERVLALAKILDCFYEGIENILKRIAVHVDGGSPAGSKWHADLLEAMAAPTLRRPAVISADLQKQLRRYLQFRHFSRHAYAFHLSWERMARLVHSCIAVLDMFEKELYQFLTRMEQRWE